MILYAGAISYKWSRESGELPPSAQINSARLLIQSVQLEYAGRYLCEASNAGGSVQAVAQLMVEGMNTRLRSTGY